MIRAADQLLGGLTLFLGLAAVIVAAVSGGPGWTLLLGAVAVLAGLAWLLAVLGQRP